MDSPRGHLSVRVRFGMLWRQATVLTLAWTPALSAIRLQGSLCGAHELFHRRISRCRGLDLALPEMRERHVDPGAAHGPPRTQRARQAKVLRQDFEPARGIDGVAPIAVIARRCHSHLIRRGRPAMITRYREAADRYELGPPANEVRIGEPHGHQPGGVSRTPRQPGYWAPARDPEQRHDASPMNLSTCPPRRFDLKSPSLRNSVQHEQRRRGTRKARPMREVNRMGSKKADVVKTMN